MFFKLIKVHLLVSELYIQLLNLKILSLTAYGEHDDDDDDDDNFSGKC